VRGVDVFQESLFTSVQLESFVPDDHPLRSIKPLIDQALKQIDWLLSTIYSEFGRESIPPERLIRAQLLQVLYSIRSERQLVEQINYNLLYRWFVGLTIDDTVWDHSTFSANRDRLIENNVICSLFSEVVNIAREKGLLSEDHFSVDGTLIQAWASHKSFRPKDNDDNDIGVGRNLEADFHGEKRSNETHESTTDNEALMARKGAGKEARLSYMGHTVMENRNGIVVSAAASQATGKAEREVAIELLGQLPGKHSKTVGADKNYDTKDFVAQCRKAKITPHVARNDKRRGGSAIDGRTSSKAGYAASQKVRKRVEEPFGWGKTVGLIRQIKVRGLSNANGVFKMTMMGWNLIRINNLRGQCA
jgi:transposase